MTTEEKMEVMKAFIEGKTIQCKRVDCNDWYDCNPAWDWPTFEYRVKPEAPEKLSRAERHEMASAVSNAVWEELMARAKTIEGPVTMTMVGFGFNDISDIVLNKILDYKPEDKAQDMNYSIDDCIDTLKSFTDWGSNAGWNALYKAVITYLNSIKELKEENEKLRKECIARRNSEEDFKWERDQYKKERDELATCLGPAEDNTERECDESVDEKVPTSEPAELKEKVKTLQDERVQMANSVSSAVWKELMDRAEDIDGPVNTRMAGFGFNDISDLVLNKILEYKPEDNKMLEYKPEDN